MQLDTTKNQSSKKDLLLPPNPTLCFTFPIKIKTLNRKISTKTLLDMGAFVCFLDKEFTIRHHLVLMKKKWLTIVEVINGWFIISSNIVEKNSIFESGVKRPSV